MTINPYSSRMHPHITRTWVGLREELVKLSCNGDASIVEMFQHLFEQGVPKSVLKSIAELSHTGRDDSVESVALYLSGQHPYMLKADCVYLILALDNRTVHEDLVVDETLGFLLCKDTEPPFDKEDVLLWELRAKCIRFQALQEENVAPTLKVKHVVNGGDKAAEYIAGAAKWVERSLEKTVPVINGGIESAGELLKNNLTPAQTELLNPTSGSVTLTCAKAAREATDGVRVTAKLTADGIRDVSTTGINMAAKKFGERKLSQRIVPGKDYRDMIAAAGRVGVAGLGAVAIVGEAVFETTKAVAQKTVAVTADVARHKYGDSAGRVVEDAGETTGNVLRTMTHVAMLNSTNVLAKTVVKNTGKMQLQRNLGEEVDDTTLPLLTGTKEEALAVVKKLQEGESAKRVEAKLNTPSAVA